MQMTLGKLFRSGVIFCTINMPSWDLGTLFRAALNRDKFKEDMFFSPDSLWPVPTYSDVIQQYTQECNLVL